METTDEECIIRWLTEAFKLPKEQARAVATARLPNGYDRLGRTATRRVLKALTTGQQDCVDAETGKIVASPLTHDKAVAAAGYKPQVTPPGPEGKLPYYGMVTERQVAFGTGEKLKKGRRKQHRQTRKKFRH